MTTLTAPIRVSVPVSRRYLAAGSFILLGLIVLGPVQHTVGTAGPGR